MQGLSGPLGTNRAPGDQKARIASHRRAGTLERGQRQPQHRELEEPRRGLNAVWRTITCVSKDRQASREGPVRSGETSTRRRGSHPRVRLVQADDFVGILKIYLIAWCAWTKFGSVRKSFVSATDLSAQSFSRWEIVST